MTNSIHLAIHTGLSFSAHSFSYYNELPFDPAARNTSRPFFPIPLILTSLDCLKNEDHDSWPSTQARALQLIQHAAGKAGTFNYHAPVGARQKPIYPDDLDDTALAYAAQQLYAPEGLSGRQLACFAQALIRAEIAVGGPYNTWLTDWQKNRQWADIDPVVNANIALALSLHGVRLPGLDAYFSNCLNASQLTSRYYLSPLTVLYFISRAYGGPGQQQGVEIIRSLQKGKTWGSPLASALAICSLLRWQEPENLKNAVTYLLKTQTNGFWETEKLYIESGTTKKQMFYGSRAVTTAICLEALALYREQQHTSQSSKRTSHDSVLLKKIIEKNTRECSAVNPSFGKRMAIESSQLLTHPFWRETVLWAKQAARALHKSHCLAKADLYAFGVAQLSGLIGYGLADRIIDRQAPVSDIPFALFATRRCATLYAKLWPVASEKILSDMELSFQDEAHGILPAEVARKSIGCTMPALAVFDGYSDQKKNLPYFEGYFLKLLEARQWNDDAHDYLDDIAAQRITPVTRLLENLYARNNPQTADALASLPLEQLQQFFWSKAFPEICLSIDDCLTSADIYLDRVGLPDPAYFQGLLRTQKTALDGARKKLKLNLSFLEAMRK